MCKAFSVALLPREATLEAARDTLEMILFEPPELGVPCSGAPGLLLGCEGVDAIAVCLGTSGGVCCALRSSSRLGGCEKKTHEGDAAFWRRQVVGA